jgi:hypothetical protein
MNGRFLILSSKFEGYNLKERENDFIKDKLKGIKFKKFIIYGKEVYNFEIDYSNILGFILRYNLRKPKKENVFKYYCSGNFLLDGDKIIYIYDDNYYLIDALKEDNIFIEVKGGFKNESKI